MASQKNRELMFVKDLGDIKILVYQVAGYPYPHIPLLREHLKDQYLLVQLVIHREHPHIQPIPRSHRLVTAKSSWRHEYYQDCEKPLTFIGDNEVITGATLQRMLGLGDTDCDVVTLELTCFTHTFKYDVPILIDHNKHHNPI